MKRVETGLARGTAAQLAMLNDQCSSLQEIQSGSARNFEESEDLRREVQRLRQIKTGLEKELIARNSSSVQQRIVESLSSTDGGKRKRGEDPGSAKEEVLEDLAREAKRRKATTILEAYRLLSRNVVVVDDAHLGVRFETFHAGRYQDRFYIVCEHDRASGLLCVWKHTLPPFVPLKQLEADHLNRNFSDFLDLIEEQLQMYVSRREQTLELKRAHSQITLRCNAACNFVHLTVPYKNKIFEAYLIYDNLLLGRPTRVNVFSKDAESEKEVRIRAKDREQLFLKHALPAAFARSFPQLE